MKKILATLLACVICFTAVGCEKNDHNYKEVKIKNRTYYQVVKHMEKDDYSYEEFECYAFRDADGDYCYLIHNSDECIVNSRSVDYIELSHGKILGYEDYADLCEKYSFEQKYDDKDSNYIVLLYATPNRTVTFEPVEIEYDSKKNLINYYYDEEFEGKDCVNNGYFCVIPTDVDVYTELDMVMCLTRSRLEELKELVDYPFSGRDYSYDYEEPLTDDKPVIYLYPEEDGTPVNVSLELSQAELTCTYPKYENGWSVVANKDGLIKIGDKEYNYLYWEGENYKAYTIEQGFCVKGCDTAIFLEEKLAELGLNRKEANEFIVYWLPLMEKNEYNVISFDTKQYEECFKLNIDPAPDTLIRVFMTWYGTDEEVEIAPQTIETPERLGFTVVEWGGSEIK